MGAIVKMRTLSDDTGVKKFSSKGPWKMVLRAASMTLGKKDRPN